MVRSAILFALILTAAAFTGQAKQGGERQVFTVHYENVLGTSFEMKTLASTEQDATRAENAALGEIDREAKILSSWDENSEFSHWFQTRNEAVRLSPELFEVLSLFDQWREQTGGALNASAEAVTRVWQRAAKQGRLPTQTELDASVSTAQKQNWSLDSFDHTATHLTSTPLAMNSFVKSYIIGHAVDAALRIPGVGGAMVNIGGDLVIRGEWSQQVNVADPRAAAENARPLLRLAVNDCAVATSGDYRRGVEIGGEHYSHIVDPRTGQPAEDVISSTVIAKDPSTAGALATAFSVMTPAQSEHLASKLPGVEYMLVEANGQIDRSGGWSALEIGRPGDASATTQGKPAFRAVSAQPRAMDWNAQFKLTIGVQLAMMQQFRVHRPYLAVWIEDSSGHPIRTLAVWFDKFQYLHELDEWYGAVYAPNRAAAQLLNSVSSATRPAGSYMFDWDGKDDAGQAVRAGRYTVLIEANREHGTHQLIKQEMDFNGTPQKQELPGGTEISAAYLDYHKSGN